MNPTNCKNCGQPIKVVPAGISKTKFDKNGHAKAYGAFYKCKECGTTESVGPQPNKPDSQPAPLHIMQSGSPHELQLVNAKLDKIGLMVKELMDYLKKTEFPPLEEKKEDKPY